MVDLEQKIRERAYQIWEQEGRIHGRDEHHWHMAKLELANASGEASVSIADVPVKKSRRTSKPKADIAAAAAPLSPPRRRRTQAPLQ